MILTFDKLRIEVQRRRVLELIDELAEQGEKLKARLIRLEGRLVELDYQSLVHEERLLNHVKLLIEAGIDPFEAERKDRE